MAMTPERYWEISALAKDKAAWDKLPLDEAVEADSIASRISVWQRNNWGPLPKTLEPYSRNSEMAKKPAKSKAAPSPKADLETKSLRTPSEQARYEAGLAEIRQHNLEIDTTRRLFAAKDRAYNHRVVLPSNVATPEEAHRLIDEALDARADQELRWSKAIEAEDPMAKKTTKPKSKPKAVPTPAPENISDEMRALTEQMKSDVAKVQTKHRTLFGGDWKPGVLPSDATPEEIGKAIEAEGSLVLGPSVREHPVAAKQLAAHKTKPMADLDTPEGIDKAIAVQKARNKAHGIPETPKPAGSLSTPKGIDEAIANGTHGSIARELAKAVGSVGTSPLEVPTARELMLGPGGVAKMWEPWAGGAMMGAMVSHAMPRENDTDQDALIRAGVGAPAGAIGGVLGIPALYSLLTRAKVNPITAGLAGGSMGLLGGSTLGGAAAGGAYNYLKGPGKEKKSGLLKSISSMGSRAGLGRDTQLYYEHMRKMKAKAQARVRPVSAVNLGRSVTNPRAGADA